MLRNPLSLCILLPRASVCICCTNERNKSFRGPCERGGKSVRENSRSKAEVGSAEWSVSMRLTVRTEDSESDGDLTPQPLPSFLLPLTPTPPEPFSVDDR